MNSADDVGHPVNLGNPEEYTVLELAEAVRDLTGTRPELVFKPLPKDDPTRRRPDITVARTRLGWYPKTKLQDGLQRTIEYFDAVLNGASASLPSTAPARARARLDWEQDGSVPLAAE